MLQKPLLGRRLLFKSISSCSSRSHIKRNLWDYYCHNLQINPLLTKSLTSGAICCAADIVCQTIEGTNVHEYDLMRIFRFSFLGSALVGPSLHYWYGFLYRRIQGSSLMPTVQRLALDQLLFAPAFIPVFFSMNLLLEGRPEQIPSKLKNDWASAVLTNYAVWVPAQFINFKFIPQLHQVLFSNIVGFFWNIYFSSITYKAKAQIKRP